jgi:chemotaxis protein MotA
MATPSLKLSPPATLKPREAFKPRRAVDIWLLMGMAGVVAAIVAGIISTGVRLAYFFQPTGALIVLGGTFAVTLITTPRSSLIGTARRLREQLRPVTTDREALIEEILGYTKTVRSKGVLSIEGAIGQASNPFLKDMLTLAMDAPHRGEFQATLETKVRMRERQGEADAKVLEVAGGFAPAIGVLGTVVGLIDVLRQFSSLSSVAPGIGTAFVSTIYGLALANLVLLPAAHRIRARVAEIFETEEMMVEGGLGLFDGIHPSLLRERLNSFLRPVDIR